MCLIKSFDVKLWPDRKYRLEDYPLLAEVPERRRWTVAILHRRDAENTEVHRMIGMQTSHTVRIGLLEFPQENKAKAFDEMRNPRVELSETLGFREKAEAVVFKEILRSLDLLVRFASRQNEHENLIPLT